MISFRTMSFTARRRIACDVVIASLALTTIAGCGNITATEADSNGSLAQRYARTETAVFRKTQRATTVTVHPVIPKAIRSTHEFTGNLLPRRRIQISAQVEGAVVEIPPIGTAIDAEIGGQH